LKATIQQLEKGQSPDVLATQEPKSFAGWRRNLILGRAHNNLGYAYWMVLHHYALALEEFRKALPYFRASDLLEEMANTTDNMGRVYAALYRRSRAESLVEDGLQLRRESGLEYRVALSLISRAVVHLAFGEPHRAQAVARQALEICEGLDTPRGSGLASLVLGRSLRQLGALWAAGVYGYSECKEYLAEARRRIETARDIFDKKVTEPVRLIEAYNELGCTYREWAALEKGQDPRSALPRALFASANKQLLEGLEQAAKWESWVQYVDGCEDMAQTFFQQGNLDSTALWLNRAEEKIPALYKIVEGEGLPDVPIEERVEEYWQHMGKVELLRGHLEYERGVAEGQGKVSRPVVECMTQHYAFAAAYFERHSGHAVRLESTFKQVHSRFKRCKIEDIRYVQQQLLPHLRDTYKLSPEALAQFFEDTLGIAAIH
jgi:tetratricopeptide (TPR) repeat protein